MALQYFELQMRGSEVQAALEAALSAYQKPGVGIPLADLAEAVQTAINSIAGKYVKPENGIPATDLASAVQTALASISGKYVRPENGIPASDLAAGVIPDVSEFVTRAVNDLMNYYLKSETYTKSEVQALIDAVKQFSYEVVAELPTASASTMHKIYLVPSANPKTKNVKDEYITIESSGSYSWEQIGTTTIDLSNYVTSQALQTALADYATTAAMTLALAGKMDKVVGATPGNIAVLDSGGNVGDSGIAVTDIITEVKTINGTPVKGSGNITIPTDGEVVIVDSLDSDSSTSALSAKQGKELKYFADGHIHGKLHLIGQGSTHIGTDVMMKMPVIAGRKYRFTPLYWDLTNTGTSTSYIVFQIYFCDTDGIDISEPHIEVKRSELPLADYYELTAPDNAVYVGVGGRGTQGVDNVVLIEDAEIVKQEEFDNLSEEVLANRLKDLDENPVYTKTIIDFSTFPTRNYTIVSSSGKYGTIADAKHILINVRPGDAVFIEANSHHDVRYAWMSSLSFPIGGSTPDTIGGLHLIGMGTNALIIAPDNAEGIYIAKGTESGGWVYQPNSVVVYRQDRVFHKITMNHVQIADGVLGQNTTYRGYAYPVKSGRQYLYTGTASGMQYYGFAADTPNPTVEVTSNNFSSPPIRLLFSAPSNGYLVIVRGSNNIPECDVAEMDDAYYNILTSGTDDNIINIINDAYKFEQVDINSLAKRNYLILSASGVYGSSITYKHILLSVEGMKYIKIKANAGYQSQLAWFASDDAPVAAAVPDYAEGSLFKCSADSTAILRVPKSAKFLYIYAGSSPSYSYIPEFVGVGRFKAEPADTSGIAYANRMAASRGEEVAEALANELLPITPDVDNDGYGIISTIQQMNAVKKAEQISNIVFTPKHRIPLKPHDGDPLTDEVWFEEGVEVKGYPYSSNNHIGRFSHETFMTAVNNPYSLLYSERVYRENQHSDWGKVYANGNGWAYYGYVCCGLTSECVNMPIKVNNPNHDEIARMQGLLAPVYPQNADGLRVGDILDGETHSIIIIGIHYTDGVADRFKIAEESTSHTGDPSGSMVLGGAVISTISRATIEGASYFGRMVAYRYTRLYQNLDYKQSPFVTCTGETALPAYVYNNDICTFAGDKVSFLLGDKVVLNYNLDNRENFGYTKINLYKDGSETPTTYLFSDIDQTTLPNGDGTTYWLDQRGHALVLDNLTAGEYVAKCADDLGNESEPTTFEVVSTDVSVTKTGEDEYKIEYDGEIEAIYSGAWTEGTLDYKHFVYASGACVFPSFWEKRAHKVVIMPKHLSTDAGYSTYGTHLEFIIKAKFGTVRTTAWNLDTGEYEEDE